MKSETKANAATIAHGFQITHEKSRKKALPWLKDANPNTFVIPATNKRQERSHLVKILSARKSIQSTAITASISSLLRQNHHKMISLPK